MSEATLFLKKKPRPGAPRSAGGAARSAAPRRRPPPPLKRGAAATGAAEGSAAGKAGVKVEPKTEPDASNIVEIKILSAAPGSGLRYNIMKLNSLREADPSQIPSPILMNRKQPGPKQPPQFAFDEEGNIVGRFVYDPEGKPVLDDEGKQMIEKRDQPDMNLVGAAPGQTGKQRRGKRNLKEVFHQDVEVIRLRREEANPWVLEPKNPSDGNPVMPEHWVGRMQEPSTLPTVLLINEGTGPSFTMMPLGRQYRFEPERPFKVMDADQANKYFEMQAKYKIHDRWGQRQEGAGGSSTSASASGGGGGGGGGGSGGGGGGSGGSGGGSYSGRGPVKAERAPGYLEQRAQRMEWNILANKGELRTPTVKREKFEDDYVRENRNIGRGLEGGADEELDYDVNDDFQDDEDSNTFYHNREEEEEKKLQEDRQKQEYRWANVNVGDRPQIEDDGDDDDLFGDRLTSEGKRLRRMMRKRAHGEEEDLYESTDDEDWSDSDEENKDKDKDKEKEKDKEKDKDVKKDGSRSHSRSGSRGPGDRSGSPSRRQQPPTPDRPAPGAGAALLAKRAASRGASPSRSGGRGSRAGSPLVRGASPSGDRAGSPAPNGRGGSPSHSRAGSPAPGGHPGRDSTPAAGASGGGAAAAAPRPKSKSAKRKATSESPLRDVAPPSAVPSSSLGGKRKSPDDSPSPAVHANSPAGAAAGPSQKKKKRASGSATPVPLEGDSFPGMITREEVLAWLRRQKGEIPMGAAIGAFAKQITAAGENKGRNQQLFLQWIRTFTDKVDGTKALKLKGEYAM